MQPRVSQTAFPMSEVIGEEFQYARSGCTMVAVVAKLAKDLGFSKVSTIIIDSPT